MDSKKLGASSVEHDEGNLSINVDELPYGPSGFRGIFSSSYVAMCAGFATLGGMLFGYEYVFPATTTMTLISFEFL